MTAKEHPSQEEFDELYKFCKDQKLDPRVRCDALLSVANVLAVLLPDYVVGKHSAKDNISRDIRERRAYEKVLLDFTRRFIQYCEYVSCGRDNSPWARAGACKALSLLFQKKHRFNTGDLLAKTVVRLACLPVPQYRKHPCNAIKAVFDSDPHGEYTLKIMQRVAETPTPNISVSLLECLECIRIPKSTGKKDKPKLEDKELQRELKEVGIIDNDAEKEHNAAAILEHLFGTVFRFLRETKSEEHFCAAMSVVKSYVDNLNIDVVPQIVEALKQRRFSLRASIIAANTAHDVCYAAKMTVDLRSFYASVYARAYEALEDREVLTEFLTLFELMKGSLDKNRTAAFAKRLLMMSLQAPTQVQGVIIAVLRQMITHDVSMSAAVDFEFEAENEFNIMLDDPDSCNGTSAKYWELAYFANVHHPLVSAMAKEMARMTSADEIREIEIDAARQKRDWRPHTVQLHLDEGMRIFDVNLFKKEKQPLPSSMKVFEFE